MCEAEQLSLSIAEARQITLLMRRAVRLAYSPTGPILPSYILDLLANWNIGRLHVPFKPLWETTMELLSQIASKDMSAFTKTLLHHLHISMHSSTYHINCCFCFGFFYAASVMQSC